MEEEPNSLLVSEESQIESQATQKFLCREMHLGPEPARMTFHYYLLGYYYYSITKAAILVQSTTSLWIFIQESFPKVISVLYSLPLYIILFAQQDRYSHFYFMIC